MKSSLFESSFIVLKNRDKTGGQIGYVPPEAMDVGNWQLKHNANYSKANTKFSTQRCDHNSTKSPNFIRTP